MKAGGGGHNPGLSPTDMVALLAARQAAEAAAAPAAEATIKSEAGQSPPPPPQAVVASGHKSPASAAATSPRGVSVAQSSGSLELAAGEDFCCILCGLKEASVDKLKDHINMHFIGKFFIVFPPRGVIF
jgi:hypothetical protein